MYEFVPESVIKPYRKACSDDMVDLRDRLSQKYGIITQFSLVGSDARNMVTRDGNGPYDLDYNLYIISMPQKYWNNLQYLKDIVRTTLNEVKGHEWFFDSQDSTSVLTAQLRFKTIDNSDFSFDIAILGRNQNGNWCRLIHNKNAFGFGRDQYTWTEVPRSHDVHDKVAVLKREGLWNEVRDTYITKKNMYLTRRDHNHPSFVVYVETVNEVYAQYIC